MTTDMIATSSISSKAWWTLTAVTVSTGVLLLARAVRRAWFSPTIECALQCPCGKIQGHLRAKREDSIRIHCYCNDCRTYARYIAGLGHHPDTTIGQPHGDNRVVQVCKNAVTLTQGQEYLKLALKSPHKVDQDGKEQVYMHRFYASCCHVPLFNTVSFLGFVGVFTDFLDAAACARFAGPVSLFPEYALQKPIQPSVADIFVPDFLWKLVRYMPWRSAGPFDYTQPPVYWGNDEKKEDDDNVTSSDKPKSQ